MEKDLEPVTLVLTRAELVFLQSMCESAKRATVAGSFAEDCRKTLHEKVGKAMNADEQTPR